MDSPNPDKLTAGLLTEALLTHLNQLDKHVSHPVGRFFHRPAKNTALVNQLIKDLSPATTSTEVIVINSAKLPNEDLLNSLAKKLCGYRKALTTNNSDRYLTTLDDFLTKQLGLNLSLRKPLIEAELSTEIKENTGLLTKLYSLKLENPTTSTKQTKDAFTVNTLKRTDSTLSNRDGSDIRREYYRKLGITTNKKPINKPGASNNETSPSSQNHGPSASVS